MVATGSIAFDYILTFRGRFGDHIIPDKAHVFGFNVYRITNGQRTKLNLSLIAGSALVVKARMQSYAWMDPAGAFDSQAPQFEIAPVQSDPVALERLVREADLPPGGLVLDAGCGPGLVSAALLAAGFRVVHRVGDEVGLDRVDEAGDADDVDVGRWPRLGERAAARRRRPEDDHDQRPEGTESGE